jgi:hypothetical protein
MKKKKDMKAADFAAQLRQDRDYLAKQAEQEERAAGAAAAERAVMEYLSSRGYSAVSLTDLVQRYAPINSNLAEDLLDSLSQVGHPAVLESVVRALGTVREDFDPLPLIGLFERTNSASLRWAIANTLAEARPRRAGQWILRSLSQRAYGKAREMLALAAARTNSPAAANRELVRLLDELPAHAGLALSESGTTQELPALEHAYAKAAGWVREELGRALAVIRARSRNAEL